ncbi:FadR/GntR family transcriptional regulator [Martelella alba]|uniref:FadR family transcriptional regulator n=1 Tax=Martelella alba TaxID=2590451 RepID=A0ABY2SRN5_9HYPH|nr:FadR/GntR family transcriptional regulator [Martelella alba]TKI08880.1 FadR family transcriptional regulator [Martelella alba]
MTFVLDVKRTMSDQVAEDLGRRIVQNEFKPGDLLPNETLLLEYYGVSRTVLREALQVLTAKGLLDSRQRKGTFVRPRELWSQLDPLLLDWHTRLNADDPALLQLMEVRRIVEPPAAALATERASEQDKQRIIAAYERMASADGQVDTFILADLEFHTAILEAGKNRFLLPIIHAIRTTLLASLRQTNPDARENRDVSLPLHANILHALLEGDAAAASAAMQAHLDDTQRRYYRAAKQRADP